MTRTGAGLAGMVVSGTPRDSLNVIDLIYRRQGGRRPEVIVTDIGSYSASCTACWRLLGFDYRPQLTTRPTSSCGGLTRAPHDGPPGAAARGRIDLARIAQTLA